MEQISNTRLFCNFGSGNAAFFASTVMSYTAGAAFYRFLSIRNQNSSKTYGRRQLFAHVSLAVLSMFAVADVLGHVLPVADRWMGLFLGLGFGFVNAVSADETAVITWAATGHMNKIGMGFVDAFMLGEKKKTTNTNLRVVGIFLSAVVVTSALWQKCTMISGISRFAPPVGTSIGLFYAAIFAGYGWHIGRRDRPMLVSRSDSNWDPIFWWSSFNRSGSVHGKVEENHKRSRRDVDIVFPQS